MNLGIFGDILSQNASQITDDLKEHFSDFATGNTGYLQNVFNLYNNKYTINYLIIIINLYINLNFFFIK